MITVDLFYHELIGKNSYGAFYRWIREREAKDVM